MLRRACATLSAVVLTAMTFAMAACGGGGGDTGGASINAPPAVGTVTVTLPNAQLQVGAQITASAEVRSTTGAVLSGRTISWASANPGVATVTDGGVIAGVAPGTVSITATSEGKVGTATLVVVPAPVNAVVVSAPSSTVVTERTLQATVTLRDERGATLTGRAVTWASSAPNVATVSDAGLITGVSTGTTTISATAEGRSGTLVLTVVPPPVNTVSIALAKSTIPQGSTTTATVQLRDDRNVALTGRTVAFTSSDVSVASVNDAGVITALAVGTTTITATSEGKSATAQLTVIQPPVATVTVTLPQTSVLPGSTVQAQVVLRDATGRTLTGRAVSFASSNPAVAGVNGTGLVTAIAPGTVVISATSEGQTGQAALQVIVPVASVVINGSTRVKVGDSYSYTATARAADGTILDRPVSWRVRESARAQMTASGNLVPLQSGSFTIVAQIDGGEWDATYTAYDWVSLTGSSTTFEVLEADARVANRFGTLAFPELVLSCGSSGFFFVWIRLPHMITQNGLVVYGFDGGTGQPEVWQELAPDYNTLWKPGNNATTKAFAAQIAASRRFGIAFGEFNVVGSRSASFRVTGLAQRLSGLFSLCPVGVSAPGSPNGDTPSLAERAEAMRILTIHSRAGTATAKDPTLQLEALRRGELGAAQSESRVLNSWPVWSAPETSVARRVGKR